MKSYNKTMINIGRLGEKKYCSQYINCVNEEKLQNSWWDALKFFFDHSFFRGRRDKLSNEYKCFTIKILEDHFFITNENLDRSYERLKQQKEHFNKECILEFKKDKCIGRGNSVKHEDFRKEVAEKNPIVKLLVTPKDVELEWDKETYNKNILLGNDEDIMMVLDVLKFISSDAKNIYNYLKNTMTNSELKMAYEKLVGMRAIANKIATFIIRDVGLINLGIINKDYEMAFPIDTWVRTIARKLGCNSKDTDEEIKSYLIKKCKESNIDPLKFAAGIWYLGVHSLDILLEIYEKDEIEIESITSANSG